MVTSLSRSELRTYLRLQLGHFFPDKYTFRGRDTELAVDEALLRTEYCFGKISLPGYTVDGSARFNHLHSDQYSQFLYFLANSLWLQSENKPLCDKLIQLNKALNGMFFSYKAKLPKVFLFGHPVGSILGNADYSEFLVVLQNVTINTAFREDGGLAPKIGRGVFFAAGSKVIGNKSIGDRVSLGVDCVVYNMAIPDDTIVANISGELVMKGQKEICKAQEYFNVPIS